MLVGSKLYGSEHTEIAGRLGKSLDAVKQIASRALRRLRAAPVSD